MLSDVAELQDKWSILDRKYRREGRYESTDDISRFRH
jgi:hypothetical protein